ncbi:MAG: hypothetical protein IJK87_04755 [Prevotella sp.]|nr:hypothetical protein [Prevotella sp.]
MSLLQRNKGRTDDWHDPFSTYSLPLNPEPDALLAAYINGTCNMYEIWMVCLLEFQLVSGLGK